MTQVDPDFRRQLEGWSLATAEITYRLPDARSILQTYLWQDYDLAPEFPKLRDFLAFWTRELEGPLHSVRLCHSRLIGAREVSYRNHEVLLH
ncbi:MAG: aspartate-semialdehyde dehydrogenase [Pseudomonadota bacterium]|nr:aspartate-semialdehyde dehydrogenase [Pseudomonadota bacterium]MEE3098742.1 aspartate-semialdehyde dehydrogenase [Pseudomonadota bacterium]